MNFTAKNLLFCMLFTANFAHAGENIEMEAIHNSLLAQIKEYNTIREEIRTGDLNGCDLNIREYNRLRDEKINKELNGYNLTNCHAYVDENNPTQIKYHAEYRRGCRSFVRTDEEVSQDKCCNIS